MTTSEGLQAYMSIVHNVRSLQRKPEKLTAWVDASIKIIVSDSNYISRPYLLAGKIKILVISDTTTNYTSAACTCFDECTSLILFMII